MPSSAMSLSRLCLVSLDQIADALRILLAMPVAGKRVGPPGRFNHDLRPDRPGGNMHRSDLRHCNTLLVAAEEPSLYARNPLRTDHQPCRKEEIPLSPAGCCECLSGRRIHRFKRRRCHVVAPASGRLSRGLPALARRAQLVTPIPTRPFSRPRYTRLSGLQERSASRTAQTVRTP